MVKIRISYGDDTELLEVLHYMSPIIATMRKDKDGSRKTKKRISLPIYAESSCILYGCML